MNTVRFFIVIYLTTAFGVASADNNLNELAREQLIAFTEAVLSGPDQLEPLLAPEYQIMRSNGAGYNRDEYLNSGIGTLSRDSNFSHEGIFATQHDDVLVVRYMLRIALSIEGEPLEKLAPRLTVFRKIGDTWKVVAHANFASKQ